MRASNTSGYSLVETMFVCALAATLTGIAVPQFLTSLDDYRAAGAARYLTARLQQLRMEAVMRSTDVAVQFTQTAQGFTFREYVDGNGNGVRTLDIRRGVDRPVGAAEQLPDLFPGVDFGTLPGLPAVEGGPPPGNDPIKLGVNNILSFSSGGTSSSGSLYIKGRRAQYVIRVFGETGKVRVLRFIAATNRWNQL